MTKGSAPALNVSVDPATNRITTGGYSYDANGNLTGMPMLAMSYSVDNRMASSTWGSDPAWQYGYDPWGRRVWRQLAGSNTDCIAFYGVDGNLLGTFLFNGGTYYPQYDFGSGYVYFGKRLIQERAFVAAGQSYQPAITHPDRVGSVVYRENTALRYFPYGEEPTTTEQNHAKFATYFRDSTTALDYAQQRYYARTIGRFTSPDPYRASAGPADPQSWNRYAYVQNDPVNYADPSGLDRCSVDLGMPCFSLTVWSGFVPAGGSKFPDPSFALDSGEIVGLSPFITDESYVPPEPKRNPPPDPECFAQLKYRAVDDPWARLAGATHAFWWVQTRTGAHFIITAGPQRYEGSTTQYLEAWVVSGDSNGSDHSGQTLAWSSGLSSFICDAVERIIAAANSLPRGEISYDAARGPNSNSAARFFGQAAGFALSPPPGSFG